MRAFVSCSINNTEKYIISILSMELKNNGFIVNSTFNTVSSPVFLEQLSINQINSSHLFIGILSNKGVNINRVLKDYQYAREKKVPSLLLVEDTIVFQDNIDAIPTVIRFNRNSPEASINKVKGYLATQKKSTNSDDAAAWLLGGAALLALIALFSNKK